MGYDVFGAPYDTGQLSDTSNFTKFKFKSNLILKAIRINIIVIDNPTFTDLNLKVYSDRAGVPDKLLATSTNVQTKAAIHTLANAAKEIFFEFAEQAFLGEVFYHLVLNGTGYSPTASKYLLWEIQGVDPIYSGGSAAILKFGLNPFKFSVISSDVQ